MNRKVNEVTEVTQAGAKLNGPKISEVTTDVLHSILTTGRSIEQAIVAVEREFSLSADLQMEACQQALYCQQRGDHDGYCDLLNTANYLSDQNVDLMDALRTLRTAAFQTGPLRRVA